LNTNLENNVKKHVDGLTMIDALTMNKCMKAVVGKYFKDTCDVLLPRTSNLAF